MKKVVVALFQGSVNFSEKNKYIFADLWAINSVTTTQICCCNEKAVIRNM